MSFGRLSDIIENIKGLDINQAFSFVLSKNDNKEYIIFLNTDDQLFDKGIDSESRALESIGGSYAPRTIQQKKFDSLPFDHVTLFDTGAFYGTFKVDVDKDSFTITADTGKPDSDLADRWGEELAGLTDESINALLDVITDEIIRYLIDGILR